MIKSSKALCLLAVIIIGVSTALIVLYAQYYENNNNVYQGSSGKTETTVSPSTSSSHNENNPIKMLSGGIGRINTVGSPKELPPSWGSVLVKVYRQHMVARPGEILKVPVKLTYIAGPQAPQKAVLLLGVKGDAIYNIYIPIYYVNLDKLYCSRHVVVLKCNTTDFDRIHNWTLRKILYSMELHSFNKGRVPVIIITRNGEPYLITIRTNDLVWYNLTRLVIRANQTVVVTMYIWIPGFIKPGYRFEGANIVGTINIVSETPHVAIWPATIKEIEVRK